MAQPVSGATGALAAFREMKADGFSIARHSSRLARKIDSMDLPRQSGTTASTEEPAAPKDEVVREEPNFDMMRHVGSLQRDLRRFERHVTPRPAPRRVERTEPTRTADDLIERTVAQLPKKLAEVTRGGKATEL